MGEKRAYRLDHGCIIADVRHLFTGPLADEEIESHVNFLLEITRFSARNFYIGTFANGLNVICQGARLRLGQ